MIQTRQLAQQMRRDVQELVDMLLSTPNMEQRTVGIGRLDPEIARDFSNVGPMVRASGHARDTRADHPFVRLRPAADGSPQRAGLRRNIPPQGADQRGFIPR